MRTGLRTGIDWLIVLVLFVVVVFALLFHHEYGVNPENNTSYSASIGSTYIATKDGCPEKNEIRVSFTTYKPQAVYLYVNGNLKVVLLFGEASAPFCGRTQDFASVYGVFGSISFRVHPNFHLTKSTTQ